MSPQPPQSVPNNQEIEAQIVWDSTDGLFSAMEDATQERYGVPLRIKDSGTSWDDIYEIGINEEVGSVENLESPRWTNPEECSEYYRRMKEFEQRTGKDVMAAWRMVTSLPT
jgi:hypothetical protein